MVKQSTECLTLVSVDFQEANFSGATNWAGEKNTVIGVQNNYSNRNARICVIYLVPGDLWWRMTICGTGEFHVTTFLNIAISQVEREPRSCFLHLEHFDWGQFDTLPGWWKWCGYFRQKIERRSRMWICVWGSDTDRSTCAWKHVRVRYIMWMGALPYCLIENHRSTGSGRGVQCRHRCC